MNILDKISTLREERHWSEYQLAEKSGLTQSTISSWYRKNMIPSIPSLSKICDAFGITLSEFFENDESKIYVSKEEIQLLNQYRALTKKEKIAIKSTISALSKK